jgi:hypothetical protein
MIRAITANFALMTLAGWWARRAERSNREAGER